MSREEILYASRTSLILYLESWGFQCYAHEHTDELRCAALNNIDTEGE